MASLARGRPAGADRCSDSDEPGERRPWPHPGGAAGRWACAGARPAMVTPTAASGPGPREPAQGPRTRRRARGACGQTCGRSPGLPGPSQLHFVMRCRLSEGGLFSLSLTFTPLKLPDGQTGSVGVRRAAGAGGGGTSSGDTGACVEGRGREWRQGGRRAGPLWLRVTPHPLRLHTHGVTPPRGRKEGGVVTPLSRAEDRGGQPRPTRAHGWSGRPHGHSLCQALGQSQMSIISVY